MGLIRGLALHPELSAQGLKLVQPLCPRDNYSCFRWGSLRPREAQRVRGRLWSMVIKELEMKLINLS